MWNSNNQNNASVNFLNGRNYGYGLPHYEIIEVNGEAGAQSIRMAPNSSVILADKTGATVWFAMTDGAGYLTVTPYDLVPHKTQSQNTIDDLAQRVSQLEEIINARQSNSQSIKQAKKQQQQQQTNAANTTV